jgi:hypothetical protein
MTLFRIQSIPWYDTHEQAYYNALTINGIPKGELANHIQRKSKPKLSPFQTYNYHNTHSHEEQCPYLIYKTQYDRVPMCEDDYDWLLMFLLDNNYVVDFEMTKMINKSKFSNNQKRLLCFFRD